VGASTWNYPHRDLGEQALPDGSPIRRPTVRVHMEGLSENLLAVVDSGSPISVADSQLFRWLGVDLSTAVPLYEVPLSLGSAFGRVPVFGVTLFLRPPEDSNRELISWDLHLGARPNWRLPFAILFGQRGWFDRFPTTIDATNTAVDISDSR
jgi:hypothetical protein